MGKHSISPARKRVFNKTMAIALAAGVSFGGVQVVGPEMGLNTAAEASAAEIPASNVKTTLITEAGDDLLSYPQKEVNVENKDNDFYKKFSYERAELKMDIVIPDDAAAGDTIAVDLKNMTLEQGAPRGVTNLKIDNDDAVEANVTGSSITLKLLPGAEKYKGRTAAFNAPVLLGKVPVSYSTGVTTHDPEQDKKVRTYDRSEFFGIVINDEQKGVTAKTTLTETLIFREKSESDDPTEPDYKYGSDINIHIVNPSLNTGSANGVATGEFTQPDIVLHEDKGSVVKNIYGPNESSPESRTVTVRISTDDADAVPVVVRPEFKLSDVLKDSDAYTESKLRTKGQTVDSYGRLAESHRVNEVYPPHKKQSDSGVTGTTKIDGNDIVITFDNVVAGEEIEVASYYTHPFGYFAHPYEVGKTVTDTVATDNGGVKLPTGDKTFTDTATLTMKSISGWADGYIPKSNVTFKVAANGQEADAQDQAASVTGDTAKFTAKLTNNGDIGESAVVIDFPKGVTDKDGKNQKVVDFGNEGFPVGTTKTIDLGELNVPDGASQNEFKATLANQLRQDKGTPLSDNAWTTSADTTPDDPETPTQDIYIDGKPDVKPDGTVTLHRNDGKDITFKVPTGSKVEVNKDGDLEIIQPDGKKETVKLKHTKVEEKGKPGSPDHKIIITDEDGKTHEFGTYDKFLKAVKDDGKGNYTFTMNDGTKLGPIKLGDDITNIADDGKGNLIVTHKDGSKDTVPLTHTTITEKGKPGDPDYAVTITTPDGKKITLDGYDNYVESIKKQPNGDYLVKRNDGTEWTIKLSDIRKDIKDLKGKDAEQDKRLDDLEDRVDGIDEEIENLGDRITKNEGAIEDHRKSINDLNQEVGSINNELGDIKDELARLDGQDIKEVRDNGDGTYTLIRNNGDEVTGTIDTSGDIKSITDNGDGTITLTKNDGSTEVVDLTHTKVETKGKPGDKDYTVTITTPDGNKVTLNGSNTYPSKVKDNGDGTYTIILNDGTEVPGKIGDGQDIKELVPNEDGTMTVIHKDGSESVVDLKQVEITEENKGTPEHTVTITSPNGDSVTFNVFDKYVTDVVKNEDGNYDIFRSDVDGGNTVWKTIVLSDLRDKISALEDRADQLEEKDADLQRQIDELKGRLDNAEKEIESLKDRTSDLEKAVAKINARLSVIELNITALEGRMDALEGRVDTVENTQHAWAQCFSGILGTAIPLLAAAPLVAGSNIQIPGAAQWNNQIQRTLGIYNEKLNRMAGQYSGVIKAAATILGVAGTIGLGVHTAKACGPYSKTDAMKETKAGKLSSKLTAKREGSSAKREESSEGSSREK